MTLITPRLPRHAAQRRQLLQVGAGAAAGSLPFFALVPAARADDAGPTVMTRSGPVRGQRNGEVAVFKGVPYGASTAGAGRFAAPRPPQAWSDVRAATDYGPRAAGLGYPPFLMAEEGADLDRTPPGEDCLVLNVWTPDASSRSRRPVMVWLHGGGYNSGSGGSTRYDGSRLAQRQDVVVVTVNHRLGALGFLYLAGLDAQKYGRSSNLGMQDIVLALEWVRDNAAAFGGDAGQVTVFGESGGASKVSTLMAMPSARGLFHRAVAESGNALRVATPEEATRMTRGVLDKLGIAPNNLDALSTLPFDRIAAATPGNISPVVDGEVLPRQPFEPDAPAVSAQVPLLIGSNLTEMTFFNDTPLDVIDEGTLMARVGKYTSLEPAKAEKLVALYRKSQSDMPNHVLYQRLASDWWLTAAAHLQAERKAAQGGAPAYVYQFAMPQGARGGKLNVPHTAEIAYVFDNLERSTALVGTVTPEQQRVADQVSGAWAAFARNGAPKAPGLPAWPAYSAAQRSVMVIDSLPHLAGPALAELQAAINALRAA